ncbi:hypothetical protein FS837_005124 [Tulasnella sp. UAMH 9824]|nr:hypothetical protein FS837_005124 [Tulasnella sp. UAMH 9824]
MVHMTDSFHHPPIPPGSGSDDVSFDVNACLEIVMLPGLLSFQDAITGQHDNAGSPPSDNSMLTRATAFGAEAYGGKPSPAHAQSPAQNMPGSYFPSNPPPPPPALPGQKPQPHGGGSHGDLFSFLGNVLPREPNGLAMPTSTSQAVKMAGDLGMQLFDKYTEKP